MVGRAGRSAQILDVGTDELGERLLVEQRLGLLVEEGLVGRAAALGDEEEFVLHAGLAAVDVNLCREVRSRVLLVNHREGDHLRIAEVALLVGLVDAAGDAAGVVGAGPYVLTLVGDADGRTGILAGGQLALGGHALVEQHRVGDELVVVGRFGVVEDVAQLLQVRRAQVERHVAVGGLREQLEARGVDLQHLAAVALDHFHVILRQKTVLGFVLPDGERLLIDEFRHGSL